MLLCSHHHRLVHEGGFEIFKDNDGHRSFRRPDGRAVPGCGYRIEDRLDAQFSSEQVEPQLEGKVPLNRPES
jgi:hypothetical protein